MRRPTCGSSAKRSTARYRTSRPRRTRPRWRRASPVRLEPGRRRCERAGMPVHITAPTRITAAGNLPKLIAEYVGRVNDGTSAVSIAHMRSPAGWIEPGQTPDFDEYTVVLRG